MGKMKHDPWGEEGYYDTCGTDQGWGIEQIDPRPSWCREHGGWKKNCAPVHTEFDARLQEAREKFKSC